MKRKVDYNLLARLFVALFLIIAITWIQFILYNQIDQFAFQKATIINFICFSVIGVIFHLIKTDLFKKETWKFNFRFELLLLAIVLLVISFSIVLNIDFIIIFFLNLGISPSIGLIPLQILFGYTLLNLFIND